MRILLVVLALVVVAPVARAQITFELALPLLRFKVEPPTVVIAPGVRVVPAYDEEIFIVERVYWLRRGEDWYRAPDHRGGWILMEHTRVPERLRELPGRYKHYKPGKSGKAWKNGGPPGKGHGRGRR